MTTLQQILSWLFGILAVAFLVMSVVTRFRSGGSLLRMSEKTILIYHLYMLLTMISFILWTFAQSPETITMKSLWIFPALLGIAALSLGMTFLYRFAKQVLKEDAGYPFKSKE